ncbi:MAG: replicative DNA helicase [Ilumatobacteraceae bacterium]
MSDNWSDRGSSRPGDRGRRPEQSGPRRLDARVPPHNLSAEESLLGALLLSRDVVNQLAEFGVEVDHFYKPAHQHIFTAIRGLMHTGMPIDIVTVADELRRNGLIDEVGGAAALLELQNATPSVSNAMRYAKIVTDTALLRRLIAVAGDITDVAFSEPDDVQKALDDAESRVYSIAEQRVVDSTRLLTDLLAPAMDTLQDIYDRGAAITGTATGFTDLDDILAGLQPSTLNIIGARPAMGKTALGLGIATHVAKSTHLPVLVFSLEMGHAELTQRIISAEAEVESQKFRTGRMVEADWTKVGRAINRLDSVPLYLDDNPRVTVMEIRAKARRTKARHGGLAMILIDYLQLMSGGSSSENRQLEVSEISRGLKILARELEVPIIALSQLSRSLESRADKRPMLADLRESGSLEQDADVVMFLYRDEVYNRDSPDKAAAELIVAKHRSGPTGVARLVFRGQYTKFGNAARGV